MDESKDKIGLATGWRWFVSGFTRYRRNPVMMLFLVMSYWTLLGLIGLIPVAGDLLVAAFAPVFLVGVLAGCRALDSQTMPSFMFLFSGFRNRCQSLMALGLLHFLITLGVVALTAVVDGGTILQFMAQSALNIEGDAPTLDPESISLGAVALGLVVYMPIMLAFAYSPLLVAWRNFSVGKALFFSLIASCRAWKGLVGLLLAILAFGVLIPSLAMTTLMLLGLNDAFVTSLIAIPLMVVFAPTVVSAFLSSYATILPETEGALKA